MGRKSPSSRQKETPLSTAQADILKSRESLYQQYFAPALIGDLQATEGAGRTADIAQGNLANVNQAYEGAKMDVGRSLAQREITGGFQGTALAGLEIARAGAASDAINQASAQNRQQRSSLIQLGIGSSPQPTTAAPYATRSK